MQVQVQSSQTRERLLKPLARPIPNREEEERWPRQ
jgi:hypothetical protein